MPKDMLRIVTGHWSLNEADLEGSTGIASLGWTYQNYANTFDLSIGLNAYTGVRKGYNTQAHASWKF